MILYAVNPKETEVQGIPCFASVDMLPPVELAILAIPAVSCSCYCRRLLASDQKVRKAFIIISAGFAEETPEGVKVGTGKY